MMIGSVSGIRPVGGAARVGATAAAGGAGGDFSQVLADVAAGAVSTLKAGEATAMAGITGNASVQQVVEAVRCAQQALHTATAVRDKLVAAYQEISRMAI